MSEFIAALPMYDWPEARGEVDAEWRRLGLAFRAAGIEAPERLVRRNADMPAVPGGIRNAAGSPIASDPATLPPDELDLRALWLHPQLLFGQTCWGPMELGLQDHVRVVGQPDYSAYEGGEGELYSSALLARLEPFPSSRLREGDVDMQGGSGAEQYAGAPPGPLAQIPPGENAAAPADGSAALPLGLLRGTRFAYNSLDSMSGMIGLKRDLEAAGETIGIFSGRIATGSHRGSLAAVAEGRADFCAVDCRSWALARRFEPAARALHVVGWTGKRKGLPYIASRLLSGEAVRLLGEAVTRL